jgi:hypothetical protein
MNVTRNLFLAAFAAICLTACAPTTQVVQSSGPHAPTTPYDVHLYANPPKKYEILGNVSVEITSTLRWGESGDATPAFNALIVKAAALGANGLLFDQTAGGATFTAVAGYHGDFYEVPMYSNPTTATATAIWVLDQ